MGPINGKGGRDGMHTEYLGHVLAELQSLARQHPGAQW
jgi:ring-1,2-phenylacetyl-CoA epoxidase subunit PaaC